MEYVRPNISKFDSSGFIFEASFCKPSSRKNAMRQEVDFYFSRFLQIYIYLYDFYLNVRMLFLWKKFNAVSYFDIQFNIFSQRLDAKKNVM